MKERSKKIRGRRIKTVKEQKQTKGITLIALAITIVLNASAWS